MITHKSPMKVTVSRTIRALIDKLLLKPSGLYLVWIHNRSVAKVAEVEREEVIADLLKEKDSDHSGNT